jgi:hypothetical protein
VTTHTDCSQDEAGRTEEEATFAPLSGRAFSAQRRAIVWSLRTLGLDIPAIQEELSKAGWGSWGAEVIRRDIEVGIQGTGTGSAPSSRVLKAIVRTRLERMYVAWREIGEGGQDTYAAAALLRIIQMQIDLDGLAGKGEEGEGRSGSGRPFAGLDVRTIEERATALLETLRRARTGEGEGGAGAAVCGTGHEGAGSS